MTARGIKTVGDLKRRCEVDDVSGCWRMKTRSGKTVTNLWYGTLDGYCSVGTLIAHLTTGEFPTRGDVWHCTCTTPHCANPAHRAKGNRSSQMLNAEIKRGAATIARIKATKRARSSLSEEAVVEIVASNDTLAVLSARFAISPSYAGRVRNQQVRSTAAAARASSVFTWGQTR